MDENQVQSIINGMKDLTFEIFCLMVEMKTQNEIAKELNLNVKQVKYHVGLVYKAFGIDFCKAETQSKRLLFTRTLVETRPKFGLEKVLQSNPPAGL